MSRPFTTTDLQTLASEQRNPRTGDIDTLPTPDLLALINAEDAGVARAVEHEIPQIARAVDAAAAAFRQGGRLIYIGAGTSGRLGVLDASECPPTFSAPPEMVVGVIAGGERALRHAVEGAEDDAAQGAEDLRKVRVTAADVVVGITASGRTPYVIGALRYARGLGARTVALTCVPAAALADHADISIAPEVGPEVLTGSTRMKSGTAQKMVLNMISTGAMIRIGKTYQNLMVDVSVSNEKLQARAVGILCAVAGVSGDAATQLLDAAGGDVKAAIVMHLGSVGPDEARARLARAGGVLRDVIGGASPSP
ncbi:MAG: N-acetylmuramic acid 6-phosphate etherase [Pseudomonadota bacterium]